MMILYSIIMVTFLGFHRKKRKVNRYLVCEYSRLSRESSKKASTGEKRRLYWEASGRLIDFV